MERYLAAPACPLAHFALSDMEIGRKKGKVDVDQERRTVRPFPAPPPPYSKAS